MCMEIIKKTCTLVCITTWIWKTRLQIKAIDSQTQLLFLFGDNNFMYVRVFETSRKQHFQSFQTNRFLGFFQNSSAFPEFWIYISSLSNYCSKEGRCSTTCQGQGWLCYTETGKEQKDGIWTSIYSIYTTMCTIYIIYNCNKNSTSAYKSVLVSYKSQITTKFHHNS